MQAPGWYVTGSSGQLCKARAQHHRHDTRQVSRVLATKGAATVQDEEGEVVGARVRDVMQKKQQDVYARQVSIAQALHSAELLHHDLCGGNDACPEHCDSIGHLGAPCTPDRPLHKQSYQQMRHQTPDADI